jgi:hypothetical protein
VKNDEKPIADIAKIYFIIEPKFLEFIGRFFSLDALRANNPKPRHTNNKVETNSYPIRNLVVKIQKRRKARTFLDLLLEELAHSIEIAMGVTNNGINQNKLPDKEVIQGEKIRLSASATPINGPIRVQAT